MEYGKTAITWITQLPIAPNRCHLLFAAGEFGVYCVKVGNDLGADGVSENCGELESIA